MWLIQYGKKGRFPRGALKRPGARDTGAGLSNPKTMSTNTPTQYESTEHEHTRSRTRVPIAGGVLVYESRPEEVGRELIGFEDVTDWGGVRSALVARGVGVGAVYHLDVLDDSTRPEPRRSEPADFGHGDSTGVQNL